MTQKTLGYVELEWNCPNCGVKNPGSQRTCSSCGSPQPENIAFQQAEHQQLIHDEAKISEAKTGADIHCGYCGTRNPANATVCSQCGADLKEGKQRAAGQVIGAFKEGEVQQVACPYCSTLNPETAQTCSKCGGSLARKKEEAKPQQAGAAPAFNMRSPLAIAAAVLLVVIICALAFWAFSFLTHTDTSSGVVQSVNWKRVIIIEGIGPVQHEDWKDKIPAEGQIGACREQARDVRKEPAPKSTEVCGTPYTIDTGTGKGQVVQDCEYHVYDTFCEYTLQEWKEVDRLVLRGEDLNASWPSPALQNDQRSGGREEEYTILFASDGKTYPFKTSDAELFAQCKPGSKWTLNVNNFGKVISIQPAQ